MKVLVTTWAWSSHYLPLVPVVWALRAAGHDVRVASQPALEKVVTASSGVFVPAGEDVDHNEVRARVMRDLTYSEVPLAPPPGVSAEYWSSAERAKVTTVFGVFAARADLMIDDVLSFAITWEPDLILYEPTSYAGPLVAAKLGIPAVRHIHGVDMTYQARDVVPALLAPIARRIGVGGADGFQGIDHLGDLTVDPCPPSMQIPTKLESTPVRFVAYNGPASVPRWLLPLPVRRRICVTWGSTASGMGGTFGPRDVVSALAGLDLDIILAVSAADRSGLGLVPANTTVVESLALHLLLPSCGLVIHQGGFGTTFTAIAAGVPQIVLPQFPDQIFAAERLRGSGAGAVLNVSDFSPDALHSLVRTLLDQPDTRNETDRLRREIASTPSPSDIVRHLEELVVS